MVSPHHPLSDYYEDEAQRKRFVTRLFDASACHYDRVVSFMSFGSGAWYRRDALRRAGLGKGMKLLDVAVGTGAVARAAVRIVGPSGNVVGLDSSIGMLGHARKGLHIPFIQGVAEKLPLRDSTFDFLSVGYALRHVSDLGLLFGECFRVLTPGGILMVLELARPRSPVGLCLGRFYLRRVVPWMSGLASGSKEVRLLLNYSWDSVENLVAPEAILGAMTDRGFQKVRHSTQFGLLSEYVASKP